MMNENTVMKILGLLKDQLSINEDNMKRAIYAGEKGIKEFEEYKSTVCALDDFQTFLEGTEKSNAIM